MPVRFTSTLNQLRAALRGKQDADLMAASRQQIDSIEVPVLVADNSSRHVAANESARELLGYSAAELARMSVLDLISRPNTRG